MIGEIQSLLAKFEQGKVNASDYNTVFHKRYFETTHFC